MENGSEQDRAKQFGQSIRYWMTKRGFTREQFGKLTGYSVARVLGILFGQTILTRAEKVKIAGVLALQQEARQHGGVPHHSNRFSELSDEELDSLFLDSYPKEEPTLPYSHRF